MDIFQNNLKQCSNCNSGRVTFILLKIKNSASGTNSSRYNFVLDNNNTVFICLGPLSFNNVISETRQGLASMFLVRCTCGHVNKIKTSKEHRSGKRGPPAFDVNTRVALGSLHAGIGQSHINNLLSTLNIPSLGSCTFKQREREVGGAIEQVTKNSCQESLRMEKEKLVNNGVNADENGLIPVACSFDMGWQKRGKGHNSRTGHAAVMSLTTGKVLDYDTKVKSCKFF